MTKAWIAIASFMALGFTTAAAAEQKDKAGCQDHPLLPTRMPSYRIEDCKVEDFGVYEFFSVKGPKTPVEGKFTSISYVYTGDRKQEPSGLAVVRNYENALQRIGGTILQRVPTWWVNAKVASKGPNGGEAWVQAEKGNGKIWLRIVEKKPMEQHIVADAASFDNDIRATGHAAVYGIFFDSDKAEVKPESTPALGEIAKLLQGDPGLKVFVVGHTDNTGAVAHNLKLSQDRAQAVMQALVRDHGISKARLMAQGCGQFAPVASNEAEEGRAKNRRVELVRQ